MEVVGDFSVGKPASECNGEAIESRFPVVKRHGPLPGDVLEWQVDDLKGRFIGGKNPMVARHLAQGHVQRTQWRWWCRSRGERLLERQTRGSHGSRGSARVC